MRIHIKKYTFNNTCYCYCAHFFIMKILSFDVGIKNLAYCLFSINSCNDKMLKILKWDVINLCESSAASTSTSSDIFSKKKYRCSVCKKNAYYSLKTSHTTTTTTTKLAANDEEVVYCKKHATETKLTVYDYLVGKSKPKDVSKKMYPHLKLIVTTPPKKQNACDIDMIILGKNLKTRFDSIFDEYSDVDSTNSNLGYIDAVIIENQIGPLAGRMKMLQGMIAQYFIMKNVKKIEFISSTNKLKLFKTAKNDEKNINENTENTYKLRKQQGQNICRSLVAFYPSLESWNQEFDKHLKKDDLADCFLQGYYYMYSSTVYNKMFSFDLESFLNQNLNQNLKK